MGPDSLRELAAKARMAIGCCQPVAPVLDAHADAWEAEVAALRKAIDAMLRECGSEPNSRYARNACIIGAAAIASLPESEP